MEIVRGPTAQTNPIPTGGPPYGLRAVLSSLSEMLRRRPVKPSPPSLRREGSSSAVDALADALAEAPQKIAQNSASVKKRMLFFFSRDSCDNPLRLFCWRGQGRPLMVKICYTQTTRGREYFAPRRRQKHRENVHSFFSLRSLRCAKRKMRNRAQARRRENGRQVIEGV